MRRIITILLLTVLTTGNVVAVTTDKQVQPNAARSQINYEIEDQRQDNLYNAEVMLVDAIYKASFTLEEHLINNRYYNKDSYTVVTETVLQLEEVIDRYNFILSENNRMVTGEKAMRLTILKNRLQDMKFRYNDNIKQYYFNGELLLKEVNEWTI